jgi:coenzyme PQQ precursor peptide PqqA
LVVPAEALALQPKNLGEPKMREWQKPTIDETESGMEVTSYLPAELDRA